jgi:hypothetical protein
MSSSPNTESVAERLSAVFRRNGYVRRQSPRRLAAEGYRGYKKGDEVRFIATSRSELASIQRWLRRAGFEPGRPFAKGRQFALPVYGRTAVQQLLSLLHGNHDA